MNEMISSRYVPNDNLDKRSIELKSKYITKPVLSEDEYLALNTKIKEYNIGDIISFKYYKKRSVLHMTGEIEKMDNKAKILYVNKEKISFDSILKIY